MAWSNVISRPMRGQRRGAPRRARTRGRSRLLAQAPFFGLRDVPGFLTQRLDRTSESGRPLRVVPWRAASAASSPRHQIASSLSTSAWAYSRLSRRSVSASSLRPSRAARMPRLTRISHDLSLVAELTEESEAFLEARPSPARSRPAPLRVRPGCRWRPRETRCSRRRGQAPRFPSHAAAARSWSPSP